LIDARQRVPDHVPVVSVFMSGSDVQPRELGAAGIPTFSFPEAAARAWAGSRTGTRVAAPAARLAVEPDGSTATPPAPRSTGNSLVDRAGWAVAHHRPRRTILRAYGVPLAVAEVVDGLPRRAPRSSARSAGPVAVKLATEIHKADVGGVRSGGRPRRRSPPRSLSCATARQEQGLGSTPSGSSSRRWSTTASRWWSA
jgi:acyl-CoA synthetase (NDP forming)